jgi:predicted metalloendopeptidase
LNEIVGFPARSFRPPFFDPKRRVAAGELWTAIGAVIVYEFSHEHFDDRRAAK